MGMRRRSRRRGLLVGAAAGAAVGHHVARKNAEQDAAADQEADAYQVRHRSTRLLRLIRPMNSSIWRNCIHRAC